jgi:hypothetical protein
LLVNLLADLFMADTGIINLGIGAVVDKRGCGRARGSKNKPKDASMMALSSSTPVKWHPGRPLGSKNKPKPSTSLAGRSVDVNTARHSTPPPPINVFTFFAIAGAQCGEQQRVPLKFTAFMDGHELCETILREEYGGGTPYEVEAMVKCISGAASPNLQRIMIYIRVSLRYLTTIVVRRNLT